MQGIAFPAVHSIISAAVPTRHTSTAVAIVTAASYAGIAGAAGAAPWIIERYSWPMVFYSFGASALLWLPFWLAAAAPSHLEITEIDEHARATPTTYDTDNATVARSLSLVTAETLDADAAPVVAREGDEDDALIASSRPAIGQAVVLGARFGLDRAFWGLARRREVWAICVAQYCQSWGMYTLFNWLPTFFSEEVCSSLTCCSRQRGLVALHANQLHPFGCCPVSREQ
jgi:ACS family sodium-dependent inorganic phosphate cotransporter